MARAISDVRAVVVVIVSDDVVADILGSGVVGGVSDSRLMD